MVLGVVVGILVVRAISYSFIRRDTCKIDKKIKYSYYDYSVDNDELGLFQTLDVSDKYKVLNSFEKYEDYYEFLEKNVKFSVVKAYKKDFFEQNNLVVIDIYEDMACNVSLNINKLFIEDNILSLGALYDLPMACGGGKGIAVFVEVPKNLEKVELELVQDSHNNGDNQLVKKPVLYLYPEEEAVVKVSFEHPEYLTTTYPKYEKEWNVLAKPNGDLLVDGKYYYALYWEEEYRKINNFEEGFYVAKENAIEFLEEKLNIIGLNDRERNEFIMYWLPILENNGHNLIYFELTEEKERNNKLIITPSPTSLLRVAMHVKKVDGYVEVAEQKLSGFERKGFVAVEWGGVNY